MKIQDLICQKETILNSITEFVNSKKFDQNIGLNWYQNANNDLKQILIDLELSDRLYIGDIALICSILSPANRWETNLVDTKNVLSNHFKNGKNSKFFTYGQNVKKAEKFLLERSNFRLSNSHLDYYQIYHRFTAVWASKNMKAPKTYNFFYNLLAPNFKGPYFTIDRHMLKVANLDVLSLTGKQYDFIKACYFEVLNRDFPHLKPSQFQAIIWANYVFIKRGILHY